MIEDDAAPNHFTGANKVTTSLFPPNARPDRGDLPDDAAWSSVQPAENPKTRAGAAKPALFSVIPTAALLHLGEVMKLGAKKYGPFNWRDTPVPIETYIDAAGRHLLSFQDGEDVDPESGMSHLAHIMACCAIIIDATENKMVQDDRPTKGRTGEMISTFQRTGSFNV